MVQVACGIDIGGSGVKGALVDLETGEYIGDQIRIPPPNPATPEAVATVCREVIDQLDVKIGVPIGVTFPAPVFNGVIPYMANLDQSWVNVDVDALMERHLGKCNPFTRWEQPASNREVPRGLRCVERLRGGSEAPPHPRSRQSCARTARCANGRR